MTPHVFRHSCAVAGLTVIRDLHIVSILAANESSNVGPRRSDNFERYHVSTLENGDVSRSRGEASDTRIAAQTRVFPGSRT